MVLSELDNGYQQCSVSVLDNVADPNITFDDKGICNYYYEYKKAEDETVFKGEEGHQKLNAIVAKIKEANVSVCIKENKLKL